MWTRIGSRVGGLAIATAALAMVGESVRADEAFMHVVIVGDVLDPQAGSSFRRNLDAFSGLFDDTVPPSRMRLTRIDGQAVTANGVLQAIRGLQIRPGTDTVVVYCTSHGALDPNQGPFLLFPRINQAVTRNTLRQAIVALGPRLGVLLTDSCNVPGTLPVAPAPQTPSNRLPLVIPLAPLFNALFFNHTGFVDIASSKDGQASFGYPVPENGPAIQGGLFTEALVQAVNMHRQEAHTWDQIRAEVATTVTTEFGQMLLQLGPDTQRPEQDTQTVFARSTGTWAPSSEMLALLNSRARMGALSVGVPGGDGVRVVNVDPGSAAAQAGMSPGDTILSFGGRPVSNVDEYHRQLRAASGPINVSVRNVNTGEVVNRQVRLPVPGIAPPAAPRPARPQFGAVVVADREEGLFVTHLNVGSPAAKAGLEYGDRIVRINGRPVRTLDDFNRAVWGSPDVMEITLRNVRDKQLVTAKVRLAR